ncbi:uncharacterized protein LOC100375330 [Saccoglossus kowalevskii]|uniref:Uncharacterized protein LOC100375330 n=1 Tax=Saccoglossus kowalevskii TaxID=10224 RepID=A0ABM0GUC7_SACKO|nr:PREDICTED: uncharacterized protein LOC100375330 [Saccoglossus kowalevskii]
MSSALRRLNRSIASKQPEQSSVSMPSYDTASSAVTTVSTMLAGKCCFRNSSPSQLEHRCQLFKVILCYMIPIFIFIVYSCFQLSERLTLQQELTFVKEHMGKSTKTRQLVANVQIERGLTVMYLYSREDNVYELLQDIYNRTDAIVLSDNGANEVSRHHIWANLTEFRQDVLVTNVTTYDVLNFYTYSINENFGTIFGRIFENMVFISNFWTRVAFYWYGLLSTDSYGIQRALGSAYFLQGHILSTEEFMYFHDNYFRGQEQFETAQSLHATLGMEATMSASWNISSIVRQKIANREPISGTLNENMWFENMSIVISHIFSTVEEESNNVINILDANIETAELSIIVISSLICIMLILTVVLVAVVNSSMKEIQGLLSLLRRQSRVLNKEKKRTDMLLNSMLPRAVSEELKRTGRVAAETFDDCSIYFSDIVGFTTICSTLNPMEVVAMLNALYSLFDARIAIYDCYKVETIGDAYMVTSGVPVPNGNKHVSEIASLALDLQTQVSMLSVPHKPQEKMKMRIGIHSGSCVAGVVGTTMPRYCMLGITVSIASKMESHGQAGKIHVSQEAYRRLNDFGGFELEERGIIDVKDAGLMKTYWLLRKKGISSKHLNTLSVA